MNEPTAAYWQAEARKIAESMSALPACDCDEEWCSHELARYAFESVDGWIDCKLATASKAATEITPEERRLKGDSDRLHRALVMAAFAIADAALADRPLTVEMRETYRRVRREFDDAVERLMTLVLGR